MQPSAPIQPRSRNRRADRGRRVSVANACNDKLFPEVRYVAACTRALERPCNAAVCPSAIAAADSSPVLAITVPALLPKAVAALTNEEIDLKGC